MTERTKEELAQEVLDLRGVLESWRLESDEVAKALDCNPARVPSRHGVVLQRISRLKAELEEAQQQILALKQDKDEQDAHLKKLANELDVAEKECKRLEEGYKIERQLTDRAGKEAGKAHRLREHYANENIILQGELITAKRKIVELEEERDRYKARVDKLVTEDGTTWHQVGDGAVAPPFGTIRKCLDCGCLVAGGPTRCGRCAVAEGGVSVGRRRAD